MLDTVHEAETPEGVTLRLHLAGPVPRSLAWAIDFAIRFIGVSFLLQFLALLGDAGVGLRLIILFLVFWAYYVLFEVFRDGQTPGKRIMKLRVMSENGTPVGWVASVVRNLLRAVDMLPFFYGFGLVAMLFDRRFRRSGDLAAGTVVVHLPVSNTASPAPERPPVAPAAALVFEEQVALQRFAESTSHLAPQRQEELADLARPLTGLTGRRGVERLLAHANWILGRE